MRNRFAIPRYTTVQNLTVNVRLIVGTVSLGLFIAAGGVDVIHQLSKKDAQQRERYTGCYGRNDSGEQESKVPECGLSVHEKSRICARPWQGLCAHQ